MFVYGICRFVYMSKMFVCTYIKNKDLTSWNEDQEAVHSVYIRI